MATAKPLAINRSTDDWSYSVPCSMAFDAAHLNAGPWVPTAKPTIGAVAGLTFLGTRIVPVTALRWPSALVDRYITCHASALARLSSGTDGRQRTMSPGLPFGSGDGGV